MDKLGFGDVIPADGNRTVLTVQSHGVIQDSDMDGNYDVSVGVESNTSADESRRLKIERLYIRYLLHAKHCRHTDCVMSSCYKMKRIIHHAKGCKIKLSINLSVSGENSGQTTSNCLFCKKMLEMCFIHAKHCRRNKCPVPCCVNLKHKLQQRLLKQRLRDESELKRRVATEQTSTISSTATPRASAQIESIVAQVNSLSLQLRQ